MYIPNLGAIKTKHMTKAEETLEDNSILYTWGRIADVTPVIKKAMKEHAFNFLDWWQKNVTDEMQEYMTSDELYEKFNTTKP